MDKLPYTGAVAMFRVCGCDYPHVVTEVLGPKKVVLRQGEPGNAFGPPEVFTLRKNGWWVKMGGSPNAGHAFVPVR